MHVEPPLAANFDAAALSTRGLQAMAPPTWRWLDTCGRAIRAVRCAAAHLQLQLCACNPCPAVQRDVTCCSVGLSLQEGPLLCCSVRRLLSAVAQLVDFLVPQCRSAICCLRPCSWLPACSFNSFNVHNQFFQRADPLRGGRQPHRSHRCDLPHVCTGAPD